MPRDTLSRRPSPCAAVLAPQAVPDRPIFFFERLLIADGSLDILDVFSPGLRRVPVVCLMSTHQWLR